MVILINYMVNIIIGYIIKHCFNLLTLIYYVLYYACHMVMFYDPVVAESPGP